jgi:hypothetical protein
LFVLVAVGVVVILSRRGKGVVAGPGLPEKPDPFVAAALLRELRERPEPTAA